MNIQRTVGSLVLGAAVLGLGSCGIYNRYERPEMQLDDLYGEVFSQVDTTASIADLGWRELFTDPCLQSLIERSLEPIRT